MTASLTNELKQKNTDYSFTRQKNLMWEGKLFCEWLSILDTGIRGR
jgi:hypothetical protein